MGLDPGIGFMHADQKSRDSLACDLMEALRPKVDAFLLDFLKSRAFKKNEFFETREGVCRAMPAITKQLMMTGPLWAKELGPVVEYIAQTLFTATSNQAYSRRKARSETVPTLLTQQSRSRGRVAVVKRWKAEEEEIVDLG